MNQMKLKVTLLVSMLMLLLTLTACSSINQANEVAPNSEVNVEEAEGDTSVDAAKDSTVYPLEVSDFTNTTVLIEKEPTRIVTLVPSETEIVFAIDAGQYLVGVNAYSDYPEEAMTIEKVGDAAINVEAVVGLEPDLVLASYSMNEMYIEAIRNLGLNVYVSDPKTYDSTISHIEQLGLILNKKEQATAVADEMRQVRDTVMQAVEGTPKPKVYLEFSPGWTVGGDEYLDELITIAGGQNISQAQAGWYEVNGEAVIESNPDVIIYPNFGEVESSILQAIQARPGWDAITAVQHNRLVEVANEPLVRVGPRLALGLQEIAKAIHPERFN